MGIGNMFSRLLNNESKEEKDERLNLSKDSASEETTKKSVDEVLAQEQGSEQPVAETPDNKASSASNGELTEERVLEVLSEVYDPEIPIDIVNLGLIYGIDIEGRNVVITMTMTAPGCPASTQIAGESKLMVEELDSVDSVDIDIVWDPPWDPSKMSEEAQQSMGMI